MGDKLSWSTPRELFNLYKENNKFLRVLHQKLQKEMQNDLLALKAKWAGDDDDQEGE